MNADDQRTAEALLRMEPDETAKRLAILKDMANGIADDLEALAKKLKTSHGDAEFQSNGLVLAQDEGLEALVSDLLKVTMGKLRELNNTLEIGKSAG
jgi:hypothetical protein